MQSSGTSAIGAVIFRDGVEFRGNRCVVFDIAKRRDHPAANPWAIVRIDCLKQQLRCIGPAELAKRIGGDGADAPGFVVAQRVTESGDYFLILLDLAERNDSVSAIGQLRGVL